MIAGYVYNPAALHDRPALQTVVEDERLRPARTCQYLPEGQCASISLLVLLCCRRFQLGNPWRVAAVIRTIYQTLPRNIHRDWWLHRLHELHHKLAHRRRQPELARLLGLAGVSDRLLGDLPRRCFVYLNDASGDFCMAPACPGHAYCAHHRHHLLNEDPTQDAPDCRRPVRWPVAAMPRLPRRTRSVIGEDVDAPPPKRPRPPSVGERLWRWLTGAADG